MSQKQKGFSLIELLIVVAIILIIAAIAIPNLLRAKMAANEASAVGSMRSISTAEIGYSTNYPASGFSVDLASLGGSAALCATATGATATSACLIDDTLATAITAGTARSGYFFTYATTAPASGTIVTAYTITGTPANPGVTGQSYFFADQLGVIRKGINGPASLGSSPIQ
ncbi:MAG: prepilin-type N-terminal cleavage/methylation domain-containing protein [Acidobacteriia bacterium]|nr:prepilin-type N-terminal cleavage/methylation domain-containing protein [Terriglobia bacterium]